MKTLITLFILVLHASFMNPSHAAEFNISIGDKPKTQKLSPEELNKHVETLKALKESAPAQAFEKLDAEQTEKVLLTALREGHKKELGESVTDVMVPIFAFFFLASTFTIPLYLRNRRFSEFQKTLQMFIEKGQPIPSGMIENGMDGNRQVQDRRRGILLLGFGVGLMICLIVAKSSAWGIGLIPIAMAAASLYLAQSHKSVTK